MNNFKLANMSFRNHHFLKAVDLYTKCISNNYSVYIYYENRALAFEKLNKIKQALNDFGEAYKLNINSKLSYEFLKKKYYSEKNKVVPILSIIIPVYNTGKYLEKCIESVVNQTLKSTEIIIINDGSNDQSNDIINDFMNKYENIVLINNASPSGNPGTPRNQGISVANGKYIAFVDSDDWIEEDYFETLVKCAVEHDADMVFSGGYVNHTGNKQNTVLYPKRNFYDDKKIDYKYHESFMIWDKIYNANLIKKLEIRLGETKAAVDVPFVLKAYYYLKKVAFCSYVGYHYRRESESSVTKRQRKGTNCDFELQAYSDLFMWAKKYNIDEQYYNIIKLKMVQSYLYTLKVINDKNFSDFFYRAKDAFSTVDSGFIGNITKIIKKSYMLKEFECVKKEEPYFFYTNYREKEKINTLCAEQCTFFLPGNKKGILFYVFVLVRIIPKDAYELMDAHNVGVGVGSCHSKQVFGNLSWLQPTNRSFAPLHPYMVSEKTIISSDC